jgi:nucleoside-diphosphate-sugar epimerase
MVLPILQNNFGTAFNLLATAEYGAGRIVLAGSFEEPDDKIRYPAPHAAAKGAASGYARMFGALYQTKVVMAKIFMVYGLGGTFQGPPTTAARSGASTWNGTVRLRLSMTWSMALSHAPTHPAPMAAWLISDRARCARSGRLYSS